MTTVRPNRSEPLRLCDWLAQEPFTLVMSSGFFGFYAHAGMLCALDEAGLRPRAVGGSSAGALVACCYAAGMSPTELRDHLRAVTKADFWDPRPGFGLLRGDRFGDLLRRLLPVERFSQCRLDARVSAFDVATRRTRVIAEGRLDTAIRASSCVPGFFQPVRHSGRTYLDGGILDRAGLAGFPTTERVMHHHLSSRSPWRRPNSPALQAPNRPNLAALTIDGVPRVSPLRIEAGIDAFNAGFRSTRVALTQPIVDGGVSLLART